MFYDGEAEISLNYIAAVALECLYLQAWRLVPAELQGVIVIANGETYTTDMILNFPSEVFGG